jgi:hypothetical protein
VRSVAVRPIRNLSVTTKARDLAKITSREPAVSGEAIEVITMGGMR